MSTWDVAGAVPRRLSRVQADGRSHRSWWRKIQEITPGTDRDCNRAQAYPIKLGFSKKREIKHSMLSPALDEHSSDTDLIENFDR
jgi:hypothetical protein